MKKISIILLCVFLLFGVVVLSKGRDMNLDKSLSLKQLIIENDTFLLIKALKEMDIEKVREFSKKIDVNTRYNNQSLLMIASEYSNLQIVKFLLDKGADINALDTINICVYYPDSG